MVGKNDSTFATTGLYSSGNTRRIEQIGNTIYEYEETPYENIKNCFSNKKGIEQLGLIATVINNGFYATKKASNEMRKPGYNCPCPKTLVTLITLVYPKKKNLSIVLKKRICQ